MRRAQHVEPHAFEMRLGFHQLFQRADTERDVLHPGRCVLVAAHVRLGRQFEEGQHIAIPGIEENMHVRIMLAG